MEEALGVGNAAPAEAFEPPGWMRNAHVQSVLASSPLRRGVVRRRAESLIRASRSVLLDAGRGVRLHGWYTPAGEGASRGLAVLIHGWEGSGGSLYLLTAANRLYAEGWSVLRLHLRDHGPSHPLNEEMFHSCRIREVTQAVARAAEVFDARPLCLGGFSLGGNFALRVAVRAPAAGIPLARVMAVCPVLDPHSTLVAMERGARIYESYFMKKWRRSLILKACLFPDRYHFGNLRRFHGIRDMTAFFVAGYTEFPDLDAYLSGYAITGDVLAALAVPSQAVLAEDDPLIPVADVARLARTDALTVRTTPWGGHCGFLSGPFGPSWVDDELARYFAGAAA
ncbi:MAG: alpha/beta fold hydrolase [Gammaproteobacteria bacterium]